MGNKIGKLTRAENIKVWGLLLPLCLGTIVALTGLFAEFQALFTGGLGMMLSTLIALIALAAKEKGCKVR